MNLNIFVHWFKHVVMDYMFITYCFCDRYNTGLVCPHGWMEYDNSCYLFSKEEEQWTHAAILCSALGSKLVEIETKDENNFLTTFIDLYNEIYWIGLSDVQKEDDWMWMDSKETLTNLGYSNWFNQQPDNVNGNENCGRIAPNTSGAWNDFHCTATHRYICETPSGPYGKLPSG
ncbi:hypothetical protein ACF0H5_008000 [Mactra antiquata]